MPEPKYYALGFHLGLLLERIDASWKQRVPEHPNQLIGVAQEISTRPCPAAETRR